MYTEEPEDPIRSLSVEKYVTRVPTLNKDRSSSRAFAQRALTTAVLPLELRKARKLLHEDVPLRLHLGCGDTCLDGWIDIDRARPGKRRDLRWDLRRGLPFPDGAAEAVFSEHLLEHLDVAGALRLLKECRRVLAAGGVLRVGVPDLERYIRSYLGTDQLIEDYRPGRPTRAIALGEVFFFYSHRSMYDFETLELIVREAGFSVVERSVFGRGKLAPSPDGKHRQLETLYVEATK
jgi:predicted SAM-dependent methyltransferase